MISGRVLLSLVIATCSVEGLKYIKTVDQGNNGQELNRFRHYVMKGGECTRDFTDLPFSLCPFGGMTKRISVTTYDNEPYPTIQISDKLSSIVITRQLSSGMAGTCLGDAMVTIGLGCKAFYGPTFTQDQRASAGVV